MVDMVLMCVVSTLQSAIIKLNLECNMTAFLAIGGMYYCCCGGNIHIFFILVDSKPIQVYNQLNADYWQTVYIVHAYYCQAIFNSTHCGHSSCHEVELSSTDRYNSVVSCHLTYTLFRVG